MALRDEDGRGGDFEDNLAAEREALGRRAAIEQRECVGKRAARWKLEERSVVPARRVFGVEGAVIREVFKNESGGARVRMVGPSDGRRVFRSDGEAAAELDRLEKLRIGDLSKRFPDPSD